MEGVRRNEARLTCVVLHWTRQTLEDGFIPGRKTDTQGDYLLWWDGRRIATRCDQDVLPEVAAGAPVKRRAGARKAFDGTEFRQVPSVGDSPEVLVQYATVRSVARMRFWGGVVGGIVVVALGGYWSWHKRSPSGKH